MDCSERQQEILKDTMQRAIRDVLNVANNGTAFQTTSRNDIVVTKVELFDGETYVPRDVVNANSRTSSGRRLAKYYTLSKTACIFPFVYDGQKYEGCTSVDHSEPRCATAVDANNNVQQWENCEGGSWKTYRNEWYTVNNHKCLLPFTYKDETYFECTSVGQNEPWCAIQKDHDGNFILKDGTWGTCQKQPVFETSLSGIFFDVTLATNSKTGHQRLKSLEETVAIQVPKYFEHKFKTSAPGLAKMKKGFLVDEEDALYGSGGGALFGSSIMSQPTSPPTESPKYPKYVQKTSNALVITAGVLSFIALCIVLPCVIYRGYRCDCGRPEPVQMQKPQPIELKKVTASLQASGIGARQSSGWS